MYSYFFALTLIIRSAYADDDIYQVALDESSTISLAWSLDYGKEVVTFEVHLPSEFGWFAIGFSDRGEEFPADYCVLWNDWKGHLRFQDAYADDEGVLKVDALQNCLGFRWKRRGNLTKFTYRRKFDTCDANDYIIEDGTTHIVWARGSNRLFQVSGLNVSNTDNGMVRVQLLKNTQVNSQLPIKHKTVEILADKVRVPSTDTTYWCHVHKLPNEYYNKHHVIQFEAIIQEGNEGLVHHMEVFHCVAPPEEVIPLYRGSCFASDRPEATQVCKRVVAAWAMGAKPFTYPEEAGLPFGGDDFNPYIMLEVHYNNPDLKNDWVDSSGVKFSIVSDLRRYDAGVIELGLEYTDKMAIPPGQESFSLSGYCVSECTAVSLPPEGIIVFGSQLHTHLTGIRVKTRHFRNGHELSELNRDDHYSTHFQEIRRLKRDVNILPGDSLITTCDYSTIDRSNITLGGFAISDEMCVNYIHYYPASSLEVCKSAISDQALKAYFQYMHEWENQPTSESNGISDNYKAIEWNKLRVQILEEVYSEAPLSMQCNMSSGDRFPEPLDFSSFGITDKNFETRYNLNLMSSYTFGQKVFQPVPPDKGSFPLDHEGLCRKSMIKYMKCLHFNNNDNSQCREAAREYLGCRMDNNLMTKEEWSKLGCTGSVATIKLSTLVKGLFELQPDTFKNVEINVITTENAKHFFKSEDLVGARLHEDCDEWSAWQERGDPVLHIELGKWADVFLIAPLDANTLAKIANGLCDNLLTCTVRAWDVKKPLLFCPAMNTRMYNHPLTAIQISVLQSWGYQLVPVVNKTLMCGDIGDGGMAEVSTIIECIRNCNLV
ncbi:hypothetical protein FQR65_LT12099 [Abscondita terminalis]|nr:hypothetical protein FQR65_LT12099 [Abscondita terminalis]